jgi:succinate-acetate transporter protein
MSQDQDTPEAKHESDYETIWLRLLNMVIVAVLMSMASTLLGLLTVVQFIIMVFNKREPNEQLAEMGTTMGVWMAKAARYQTAASEVKPWPWTELD